MTSETIKFGLFAYELVRYFAAYKSWTSTVLSLYRSSVKDGNYFDENIGDAILLITDHRGDIIYNCYEELDDESVNPRKDFTVFALNAVPLYFPDGYTPDHFLSYCAILIGVATMFYDSYRLGELLDAAAEVIQSVLTYFTLIGDFDAAEDIPELIKVSKHCCEKLRPDTKQ